MKLATDKLINVYKEKEISYEFESMPFENYNIKFDNVSFYYEEDKPVELCCQFCGKKYEFSKEEIGKLIKEGIR